MWEIIYSKLKIIAFITNFRRNIAIKWLDSDKSESKYGTSVSDVLSNDVNKNIFD